MVSELSKFFTLKKCNLLYANYTLVQLFFFKKKKARDKTQIYFINPEVGRKRVIEEQKKRGQIRNIRMVDIHIYINILNVNG